MIKFAAITPHPPLLVPGVGTKEDLKLVNNTIQAMQKLENKFEENDIDTVIVISPHNMVFNDRMCLIDNKQYKGDFSQFGKTNIGMDFTADNDLIDAISKECEKEEIPIIKFNNGKDTGTLDHGAMVPLTYLTQLVGNNVKLILITYSYLDRSTHIKFGEAITKVCSSSIFKNKHIAVIASGDMSHRLFSGAPAGYANEGKEFDEMIVRDLQNNDFESITHYDEDWVEAAGECGYRSILILIGALKNHRYSTQVLSYEGPFGVGYLVTDFVLK